MKKKKYTTEDAIQDIKKLLDIARSAIPDDKIYSEFLERLVVRVFKEKINDKNSDLELIGLMVENLKNVLIVGKKINKDREKALVELSIYRGRKVSAKNAKLYEKIDNKLKERKRGGLSNNLSETVDIITAEEKLSRTERNRLYRNYIKHRKTTLRKVS